MNTNWKKAVLLVALLVAGFYSLAAEVQFRAPQQGEVYKEFSRIMDPGTHQDWRVTDPNATFFNGDSGSGNNPFDFLPNSVLDLTIDDLNGAIRAEAVMAVWGGHVGTTGKKVRFNGNDWIPIPELAGSNGIPSGHDGQCYTLQMMATVDVPLSDLFEGTNTFQGESGGQTCYDFGWGQFGWYAMMVRVYYDPVSKTHPTGSITSPLSRGVMDEDPTITATVSPDVDRVDFLAYFDGYDTDGDGAYSEYHRDYHPGPSESAMSIKNHVGTATSAPYQVTWNTRWVPDQVAGGIKIIARLRSSSGVWYVTEEVVGLSLQRTGKSVKLYKPGALEERAWTNLYGSPVNVDVTIPGSEDVSDATGVVYHWRSWNGLDVLESGESHFYRLNSWYDSDHGGNHTYSYDVRPVPTSQIYQGNNQFEFNSNTAHHGIEVLWPGPSLSVEFTGDYASPIPAAPILASPSDGAQNQSASPQLAWYPAPGAISYRVQVSEDAGFSSLVVDDSTVTDTLTQVGPLDGMTTYHWRVQGQNAAGLSVYSAARSFTTFVGAPNPIAPADMATGQPTSLAFRWSAVAGATSYHLQVGTDSTFGSGVAVNDSTIADTSTTVSGLQNETTYYWRVAARTGSGNSEFSPAWSFGTMTGVAGVPALVSPLDQVQNQPSTIVFVWRSAFNADTYQLQVSTDSLYGPGVVFDDSTLTDTTETVSGLAYETRYFWRVSGKGPGGRGPFSASRSFTTSVAPPGPLSLLFPTDASTNQPTTGLTFGWRSAEGALWYRFQLATDSTFASGIVKNDSTLTDTTRVVSGLQQNSLYFWRGQGRNDGGSGPFSPVWSFRTYQPLPGQVELISPAHQATVSSDSAVFQWFNPGGLTNRYWFEIGIDSTFGMFTNIDSLLTDTVKVFGPLMTGKTYYWRVRGGNLSEWGPFSLVRNFSVIITDVEEETQIPDRFTLSQNYPNPFNPSTQIQFGVPREGRILIEVYNLLGERVATLIDGHMSAGAYTVRYNASDLPSGIYYYRMTAAESVITRKMLLVK